MTAPANNSLDLDAPAKPVHGKAAGQRKIALCFTLSPAELAAVDALATRQYNGNRSGAVSEIIRLYRESRHVEL